MQQSDKELAPLITQYHYALQRLARIHLIQKHLATDIPKYVVEELYEQQLLFDGPHLRVLLIQRIQSACYIANRLHQSSLQKTINPFYQNPIKA